ncbi:hypothetical protein BC939DRAFT_135523 [Gamsiella multidivaricata]|uniref:uncharacterized protein n=1 Tax=Gamsiella multidivaricata TaxID=101098 RepID=UPI00221E8106|nr:uncharacterized protein BC939DRAFT_135523 [Gamsiella multidivaricata]KAI7824819.1 hypothetical protein BC939DRAFT_135523 [Gamsiella multidivaricata]
MPTQTPPLSSPSPSPTPSPSPSTPSSSSASHVTQSAITSPEAAFSSPLTLLPHTRVAPMTTSLTSAAQHTPSAAFLNSDKHQQDRQPYECDPSMQDDNGKHLNTSTSLSQTTTPVIQPPEANPKNDGHTPQQDQAQSLSTSRTIPSTFITLADGQDIGSDDDELEGVSAAATGSTRRRNVTTEAAPSTGPYLSTGTVGQRSLSTPNLHADNSLIISPANSPPGSPGLPAIASVTDSSLPLAMSLDSESTSSPGSPSIMLSPAASPNSSPRLTPRASTTSVSGIALSSSRTMNTDRQGSRPSSSKTAKTSTAVPDSVKTLKSSKNKTINRHSVTSLFDTGASSMTLPTNFARKGSLTQDAANAGNNAGLAGLFVAQSQDLTSTPFSLTLAEFRLNDIYPKRQRRLLTVLHRMDSRLRKEGVIKKLTKEQLKGKPDKEIMKPNRKSLNKEYAKKGSQGGFMAQRVPAFLRSKKLKKRTRPVILHNIEMAIRDKKPELALQYISLLPSNALKKKKKKSYSDLNHCMLLAMIYRMEQVAIELVERGFPIDVNYPIIGKARDEYRTKPGRTGPFEYPSYFIVAVGLGMADLVHAMIKNANLNQSWCGLTPLLLATTLNECTNATCPPPTLPPAKLASMLSRGEKFHLDMASQTLINQLPSSFNKSTNTQFRIPGYTPTSPNSIVTTLLEYGADPNQGITLQQYLWANKLKGMGVLSRRRKTVDSQNATIDNPIEFYIAARRHESGRQWLSHEEIKARKAAKTQAAQPGDGKKRFSPEMQEFWKGKSILPVELAIASGNFDCARSILQRLNQNSLTTSSFGLLLQNDVMLTLSLIKSGSPVSQHDLHGCTPLHLAARRGHLEMVMVLVQLGGDVNSRGERQWTPLHESISQNHSSISSLLIACGADLQAKNDAGETPEDVGRRRGLAPEILSEHLDVAKAKNRSAGIVNSFASHLSSHVSAAVETRSGASSRRGSFEQLTSNTLQSMIMGSSERNASLDQSRLSQHYTSPLADISNGVSNNNNNSNNNNSSSSSSGFKSPLSRSEDSLHQTNGSGSGPNTPLTPTSSTSSLNGSRGSHSEKKKKVRGFLKKIFN